MKAPSLKTYEEFIAHFEKDTDSFKMTCWKQYEFACKERDRLREKLARRRNRIREAIPPEERKKVGRPRKNPQPTPPFQETPAPGSEFSA